jgi:tRNA pseudouridine13 synthase
VHIDYDRNKPLAYATPDFPGVGGSIRARPEDFFVQEIPAYEATGEGEHVLFEIQKVGMTTFDAVNHIARVHNIDPREIGYAGLKDANAVTRQVLSAPRIEEAQIMASKIANLQVLWAAKHRNKVRLGHLKGNRFAIRIREVDPLKVVKLRPVIDQLQQTGMPNYFGEQRFGKRQDNDLLGAAVLSNNYKQLMDHFLGGADPMRDTGPFMAARSAYDAGDLEKAIKQWPRSAGVERRALARLIKTNSHSKAARTIPEKLTRLWVSALQSRVFNRVVEKRIASLGKLVEGELAFRHDNGAVFKVEDIATEQSRADAFLISPSGPLPGHRMTQPSGEALAIEQQAAGEVGAGDLDQMGLGRFAGARRALRVRPEETTLSSGTDEHGPHITLAFTLPAGSFATVLLREVMKVDQQEDDA